MPLPRAIMRERDAEQKFMQQHPPALAENVIRKVRAYLDKDGDFVIDFENYSRLYALIVILRDNSKLGWKECQALADCMKIAARGTEIDNESFMKLCTDLEAKYVSTNGPVVVKRRLCCCVNPGPGNIKVMEGDVIAHMSISFDNEGDLIVEASTFSKKTHRLGLCLPTMDNYFFREDCKAFIDFLYVLETGDKVDHTTFLCAIAVLRKKYNYVILGADNFGKPLFVIVASRVPNDEPLHPTIQRAVDRMQLEMEAEVSSGSSGGGTNGAAMRLPRCPYPGMRYTRALQESGQAQVYAGVNKSGKKVAVKVFSGDAESAGETYRIELRMLLKMREHRNVIEVLEFFETPKPALVTRLIEGAGDMSDYIERHGSVKEGEALRIAAELADGIAHLHSSGIVHRDLKPANILLQKSSTSGKLSPVIIDLGLGSTLRKGKASNSSGMSMDALVASFAQTNISEQTDAIKGTMFWMAPEMITRQEWSEKTDVFAFGIILWELLSGKTPYNHIQLTSPIDLLVRISTGARPDMRQVRHVTTGVQRLIQKCWAADPKERPSMLEVVDNLQGKDPVAIFKSMDSDGNNRLDFGEFVKFLQRYAPDVPPADMYEIFNAIDEDSSGDIALGEFLKFWKTVQSKGMASAMSFSQRARRAC